MSEQTTTTIEREIDLPLPAEEAWELVADDEALEQWLAPEVDLAPEPGTPLRVREDDGTERIGVIDVVEPGERLGFRWWPLDDPDAESAVELVLVPVEGGTRLVVTETLLGAGQPADWTPRLQSAATACALAG